MSVSLVRHALVSLVPAGLIGAPLASLTAATTGASWGLMFTLFAAPIAILWGALSWREELLATPIAEKTDPCFGEILRYRTGGWEAQVDFGPTGRRMVVMIEADEDGPRPEQRARFETFTQEFDEVAQALSRALGAEAPGGTISADALVVWGAMLPQDPESDGEVVAACSLSGEEGESASFYMTLRNGEVVGTREAVAA